MERENEEVVDITTEQEETESTEQNNATENDSEITYEQALAWKEQLAKETEARIKAEKAVVEKKKALKSTESNSITEEQIEKVLAEREFYKNNPEALEYKDQIKEYQKKDLPIEDAYLLASKNDRQKEDSPYSRTLVGGNGTGKEPVTLITSDAYLNLPKDQRQEYEKKVIAKYGEVAFK